MPRPLLSILVLFAVFVAISMALYSGGLNAPLFYDSAQFIEKAYSYAGYDSSDLIRMMTSRRSASRLSFYLNYLLTGMDPFFLRATNVGLHAACAVAVTVATYLLMILPGLRVTGTLYEKRAVSVFVGLLYLVHPLQVFVVLYVWQRVALLACLFFFASLACYLASRTKRLPYPSLGYASAFLLFLLALASKENAIALVPTVLLIEYCAGDWRAKIAARHWAIGAAAVIAFAIILWMISFAGGGAAWSPGTIMGVIGRYYKESGLTVGEVTLTQFRVWFSYLYMILFPVPTNTLLVKAVIISKSLTNPPLTLAALGGILVIFGAGLALLRRRPLSGIGICLFLINLIPEAMLVPHFQYFAYRAIVPMVGLLLVLADVILWLLGRISETDTQRRVRVTLAICLVSVLVLCSLSTVQKARAWHQPVELWKEAFEASPRFGPNVEPRITSEILNNLGRAIRIAGKGSEAVVFHQQALSIFPGSARTLVALGKAYLSVGESRMAELYFREALKIKPDDPVAHCDLARVLAEMGKHDKALAHANRALNLNPRNAAFINALGYVQHLAGNQSAALRSFQQALHIAPSLVEAQINLGTVLMSGGKFRQAIPYFQRALAKNPENGRAHNHLGVAFAQSGDLKRAVKHFRRALAIDPKDHDSRRNLNIALNQLAEGSQGRR